MKKRFLVFLALLGIGFGFPGSAAATVRHTFESSPMLYYFDYREKIPLPLKSTEENWLMGSRFAYGYGKGTRGLQGRILFEYARAGTNYDGTDQEGTALNGVSVNTFFTGEVDLGYRVPNPLAEKSHLMPYVGLGYRYRDRDLDLYSENFNWQYLPLGLRLDYQLSPGWNAVVDLSLRFMLKAAVKVRLSQLDPELNDPQEDMGNEIGYKIALPVSYRIRPQWSMTFSPWYEQIDLGRTAAFPITAAGQPVGEGYVPASQTRQYGLYLGVRSFF
jgi:hypothetical protein